MRAGALGLAYTLVGGRVFGKDLCKRALGAQRRVPFLQKEVEGEEKYGKASWRGGCLSFFWSVSTN